MRMFWWHSRRLEIKRPRLPLRREMYSSTDSLDSLRVEVDSDERMEDVNEEPYPFDNFVLDIQGFRRSSNIFVPKEVAILSLTDDKFEKLYLFDPPCKWNRLLEEEKIVNRYLEYKFHGIPWKSGKEPHENLIGIFQSTLKHASIVYVKGFEKKKLVEAMLPGR